MQDSNGFYAQTQYGQHAGPGQMNLNQQGYPMQPYGSNQQAYGQMYAAAPMGSLPPTVSLKDWGRALFGTGGLEGEPSLLEELEINIQHMTRKTMLVLNPLRLPGKDLVDDHDCWGPLLFALFFAASLLLSGKALFSFIYGLTAFGCAGLWVVLNLMASGDDQKISWPHALSILGYCLLPMVILSWCALVIPLSGVFGLIFGGVIVLWCTASASNMFVAALSMRDQRFLVAYPIALFYSCFALMTIF